MRAIKDFGGVGLKFRRVHIWATKGFGGVRV